MQVKDQVRPSTAASRSRLRDKDRNSRNPRAILDSLDLNKGNKQVAHGVDRVLRPIDL